MVILGETSQTIKITSVSSLVLDSSSIKMLAILQNWDGDGSCREDNTQQYLFLLFFKTGLDWLVLSMCFRRLHTSFMNVCSLSVLLADMALTWVLASVWFLGPARSPVSVCFVLAHASATYAALPLTMLGLGLLDYAAKLCYHAPCSTIKNYALVLLVWVLAGMQSFCSAVTEPMEIEYSEGREALVCQVQDSMVVSYFCAGLSVAIGCILLLHCTQLPRWLREANRLSEQRDNVYPTLQSDLLLSYTKLREPQRTDKASRLMTDTEQQSPILYVSLTLCIATSWMPYLILSIACQLLGFAVPAYVTVNLLWLECANSLLVGMVFWLKSDQQGPYSDLPEDFCIWRTFWHLSRGTEASKYQVKTETSSGVCESGYV